MDAAAREQYHAFSVPSAADMNCYSRGVFILLQEVTESVCDQFISTDVKNFAG